MSDSKRYYLRVAAAFVRGKYNQGCQVALPERLLSAALDALSDDECEQVHAIGRDAGLKLHKFKRTMELRRVLGVLWSLLPAELLDIGSGRGVFLWPTLDALPDLAVTAVDRDERRASDLVAVRLGGVKRLTARQMDATALEFDDGSFDVVTLLEVLEHIERADRALAEVVRVARRFVVLSVPLQEDNNPEHIHLFDRKRLAGLFADAGVERVNFDYVPGHLIAVTRVTA